MQYIPINPKTIINISPQKYGWIHLQDADSIKTLPKTALYINNSWEINELAKMVTSIVSEQCEVRCTYEVITTTDNKAFIDRFYALIRDNLDLGQIPQDIDIREIGNLKLTVINHPNNAALNAVWFVPDYFAMEQMLRAQLVTAGVQFPRERPLSKEELETPLVMDEEILALYSFPVKDDKTYYLSPIALRYITYIYASIVYQFLFGK